MERTYVRHVPSTGWRCLAWRAARVAAATAAERPSEPGQTELTPHPGSPPHGGTGLALAACWCDEVLVALGLELALIHDYPDLFFQDAFSRTIVSECVELS